MREMQEHSKALEQEEQIKQKRLKILHSLEEKVQTHIDFYLRKHFTRPRVSSLIELRVDIEQAVQWINGEVELPSGIESIDKHISFIKENLNNILKEGR